MHCEQGSSTIVLDSSDSHSEYMFEDLQSLTDAEEMLDVIAEDVDKYDNCPTPPRPKKSKGTHAAAVLYKCNTMQYGQESSLSLLQCQVIHTGKLSITLSVNNS